MDNLLNKLNFISGQKSQVPGKNLLKVVKFQNLVENVVMCENITLQSLQIFSLFCYVRKLLPLSDQKSTQ